MKFHIKTVLAGRDLCGGACQNQSAVALGHLNEERPPFPRTTHRPQTPQPPLAPCHQIARTEA